MRPAHDLSVVLGNRNPWAQKIDIAEFLILKNGGWGGWNQHETPPLVSQPQIIPLGC